MLLSLVPAGAPCTGFQEISQRSSLVPEAMVVIWPSTVSLTMMPFSPIIRA